MQTHVAGDVPLNNLRGWPLASPGMPKDLRLETRGLLAGPMFGGCRQGCNGACRAWASGAVR